MPILHGGWSCCTLQCPPPLLPPPQPLYVHPHTTYFIKFLLNSYRAILWLITISFSHGIFYCLQCVDRVMPVSLCLQQHHSHTLQYIPLCLHFTVDKAYLMPVPLCLQPQYSHTLQYIPLCFHFFIVLLLMRLSLCLYAFMHPQRYHRIPNPHVPLHMRHHAIC